MNKPWEPAPQDTHFGWLRSIFYIGTPQHPIRRVRPRLVARPRVPTPPDNPDAASGHTRITEEVQVMVDKSVMLEKLEANALEIGRWTVALQKIAADSPVTVAIREHLNLLAADRARSMLSLEVDAEADAAADREIAQSAEATRRALAAELPQLVEDLW